MPYTGELISDINGFLREQYDMSGVQALRHYQNPLLERIQKVSDPEDVVAHLGGRGHIHTIQTKSPMNAQGRVEDGDVPLPGKHDFQQLKVQAREIVCSTGITQREQQEATRSAAGVANLVDIKLTDLKNDLKWRLALAAAGDGTGRMARVASWNNTTKVATVDNTAADFGWAGTKFLLPGMLVDICTPSDSGNWTKKVSNGLITALTATTITIDLTNGTQHAAPDDNDIVFLRNSTQFTNGQPLKNYLEVTGILHIADDGTSKYSSGGTGSYAGSNYYGLNRTIYPTLQAKVYKKWNNGNPVSWDLEDLMAPIDAVRDGFGGGKITALYCSSTMARAIARKAAAAGNATQNFGPGDNKITGGFYTRALNANGNLIPIIPMGERINDNTIFGLNEDDMVWYNPVPINFVSPYGETGNKAVFFGSPGARDLTFEAWLQFQGQLYSRRCDNHFRIEGLRVDE